MHNAITSATVPEIIAERGGIPVRSRVGHTHMKSLMAEHDAVFGREHAAITPPPTAHSKRPACPEL